MARLVIDATGLKVYGEGKWKIRKHGKEKRRVWRKLQLGGGCRDPSGHRCRSRPGDGSGLARCSDITEPLTTQDQTGQRRCVRTDTKACHALLKKRSKATIPPDAARVEKAIPQRGGDGAQGR